LKATDQEDAVIASVLAHVPHPATPHGPGDDAAVYAGRVVTTDLLIEGTHFVANHPPEALGWKALAVNLSDIAAMGAVSEAFTLGLSLPKVWSADYRKAWVDSFASGLGACARWGGATLIGGDTVSVEGGIAIAITAFGRHPGVPPDGRWLRRDALATGDRVLIYGTVGRAGLGLRRWLGGLEAGTRPADLAVDRCVDAQLRPTPPLWAGPFALRHGALAGMDLSDGLATDLPRLARASGVDLAIELGRLPEDPALRSIGDELLMTAVDRAAAGEDYGLVVTVQPSLAAVFVAEGFIDVGEAVESDPGRPAGEVHWYLNGVPIAQPVPAFTHFPDPRP